MKKAMIAVIFLMTVVFPGFASAAVNTEELAIRSRQGQELFDASLLERNRKVEEIMADLSQSPQARERAVRNVQEAFLKQSREIHLKYREPFIQRVIAETNAQLPEGGKIRSTMGSDIYLRDRATGRVFRDAKGRKILNPKHRGMQGDLDLGGDPRAVKRLEETFDKYKAHYLRRDAVQVARSAVTSTVMDAPGYRDFGDVEVTINASGEPDLPGSSAHKTRVQMDAFSKETYVSASMRRNQVGRSLVETSDHIKKATEGLATAPADLLGWQGEKRLQGMSKGTLKSIGSGSVSDAQLARVLEESGYQGDVTAFRGQLESLKEGHLHQGVGLTEGNIEAFQQACRKTTEQALDNARQDFDARKAEVQARIDRYEASIASGELSGDQADRYRQVSRQLREDLADATVKIEETSRANRVKLEGGSYDDYSQRQAITNVTPVSATPKMTRMKAIKEGLKPGLLDVAGYGVSVYSVYDNIDRMQKGEISRNDAVIGVTTEVIDTGFGVVTDVGTAAAVGSIGTGAAGAVATVGFPLVITAASGYAVSKAVEEGLKAYEAFKVEEISGKIAKSKKEEVINRLQFLTEEMLKAGEATGNWRFFARADNIVDSLERMHQVTGDDDFRETFHTVYNRVTQKKETLEAKYGCSIYALQKKMQELKAAQEPAKLRIRASRTLVGDQTGTYSITVPEGFEAPLTVRIDGGGLHVSRSSNPLRGRFRGTPSASDSTHNLSFVVKDVKGRNARGTAAVRVRGLDPKTLASRNRPKQKLYAAPPPTRRVAPAPVEDDGPDYNQQLAQIMKNYQQESKRIDDEHNARMQAIDRQYRKNIAGATAPRSRGSGSSSSVTPRKATYFLWTSPSGKYRYVLKQGVASEKRLRQLNYRPRVLGSFATLEEARRAAGIFSHDEAKRAAGIGQHNAPEEFVEMTAYRIVFKEKGSDTRYFTSPELAFARPVLTMDTRYDQPFRLKGKLVYTSKASAVRLPKKMKMNNLNMVVYERRERFLKSRLIR